VLACAWVLAISEEKRTELELNGVLSAYLSDGILRDAHDWGSGKGILIVLQRETERRVAWGSLLRHNNPFVFTESSWLTRSSFILSNALPTHLEAVLRLPAGVSAVSVGRSELQHAELSGEFQTRFPNSLGYIAVSRAGFNFNKTEAIFYIDHFCGLCGGGRFVLMRKTNGIWKVADERYTWIS
jgi:hypothetical protein